MGHDFNDFTKITLNYQKFSFPRQLFGFEVLSSCFAAHTSHIGPFKNKQQLIKALQKVACQRGAGQAGSGRGSQEGGGGENYLTL